MASWCVCLKPGAVRCGEHGLIDDEKRADARRRSFHESRLRETGEEPQPEPKPVEVHPDQESLL